MKRERTPRHGDTVTEPSRRTPERRRRWCAYCDVWTWETGDFGSGVFRHGKRRRTRECQLAARLDEVGR